MSDLGTNRYRTAQFQGNLSNPAGIALNDPRLNDAKKHAQNNPIGKIVGDVSKPKEDPLKDLLKTVFCGAVSILPLHFLNNIFVSGDNFEKTHINNFFKKVDNFSKKKLSFLNKPTNFLTNQWNKIINFKAVKHFIDEADTVKPLNTLARGAARSIKEELTESLINQAEKLSTSDTVKTELKNLSKKLSLGAFSQKKAYEELSKLTTGIKFDKEYHIINNKIKAISTTKSNSLLSKALKKMYSGANRVISKNILNIYFIGESIKKAVEAPKGDKFSTLMEGLFGEVIPYWVLMNSITKFPYQTIGGLKTFGEESGKFINTLTKPIRLAGNTLAMGLKGELTPEMAKTMDKDAIIKLFNKAKTPEAKELAFKEFTKLSNTINEGKGGPKGIIGRIMSGDWKIWKKANDTTWKEMNQLFKNNVGIFKRIAIKSKKIMGGTGRLAIVFFALIPLVGNVFKKMSHKIFGKPQSTIDEENKEKSEKAEQNKQSTQPTQQTNNASSNLPLVNKFLNKTNETNPYNLSQTQPRLNTTSPLVSKYLNQVNKTNPAQSISNQPIINKTNNNTDYSAIPNIIGTDPAVRARVNAALSDVDQELLKAQKTLDNS